jgi:hypothetical protein
MNQYDVAISLKQSILNQLIDLLFNRPTLKDQLFRGSQTATLAAVSVTVEWEIQQPPKVMLSPPDIAQWQKAIKQNGDALPPVQNAFVIHFPALNVSRQKLSGEPDEETIALDVIGVASLTNNQLVLTPIAAVVDLSHAKPLDRLIFKTILIPQVLQIAGTMLSHQQMPRLDFQGVQFGSPVLTIGNGQIIVAANLAGKSPPATPSFSQLPNTNAPFYVLLSRAVMQQIADREIQCLQGKSVATSGTESFGLGRANYRASATLNTVAVQPLSAPASVQAHIGVEISASAGVDIFSVISDRVTDTVDTVGKTFEEAGEAIENLFGKLF